MPENQSSQNTSGGYGLLKINVYRGKVGVPAENAEVSILDPETNVVIEQAKTDSEGQLPPIRLTSPPLANSDSHDAPRPFNQYNMRVRLADFGDALVDNIQIYPDTTAIQNVSLKPLIEDIYIPYPVLWGDFPDKIPEAEIKKLPFPSNLVVLPKPVVPSIIIVHDGVPSNRNAANYTVPFKDYIKNVASSEIYASWPKETLKANILAIISFTMNRIYTEWYRSKGYDFTITNSTAYDQSFNYGRNIYQEISDIVDEVFTLYISRTDVNQPLFAQYCDGIRIMRDGWLSQWGSKELGDKGFSAIQILRNYYGYDINLNEAEKVEGIPLSFSGVLSIGSQGQAVTTIQNQLNRISDNYPAIPKLIEDGIYGSKTAASVKKFQEIFDLPVTSTVNFSTWYAISDIYNAITSNQ